MISWEKGDIDGFLRRKLAKHQDGRGCLCETFRRDELPADLNPVMSYVSFTEPGASRGPHSHFEQTDIFSFPGPGNFLLKLWDNREESITYGSYMELNVGEDNPVTVIIPPGVVHGYKNISAERGLAINYPDRLYKGWGKTEVVDEVRHEDSPVSPFKMV